MIKSKCDQAVACFNEGFNCSQAVFSTYCEDLGLDKETALKVACPFGGGVARSGELCGAVSGAYMVIGLKEGKYRAEDNEARETTYRLIHEFTDKFKEMYGSILCKEILNCDISIDNGRKFAIEHGLFKTVCPGFVRDASRIVEDLLKLIPEEEPHTDATE